MCETKLNLKFEDLKKKILDTNKPELHIDLINLYYDTREQQYNEGRKSALTEKLETNNGKRK